MNQTTKRTKIIYWLSTIALTLFILPGIFFAGSKMATDGTRHLGLPMWFHWELSIGKFIGGIILLLPFFPKRIKEWAYVAFGIDFISAFIAHLSVDGTKGLWYAPVLFIIILVISYITYHKLQDAKV